jgi:2-polyprenyl-3-methyl-5-hydroxy-6-metoxy-1,4-benzoquinol methylase
MSKTDNIQKIQEEQYSFPYHYIPTLKDGNFSQHINWSWGINYMTTLEFIISQLKRINFKNLCDVGTGDGRLVNEISKIFPQKKISGIDSSQKSIEMAKLFNPTLDYEVYDILKNNSYKNKHDIITLIEVFEHIPINEQKKFIKGLYNLLTPGGILLLTVPSTNKKLNAKHYQHFTKDMLEHKFINFFQIEKIIYFEHKIKLEKIIKKILTNKLFILNHQGIKNYLYRLYQKKCFFSTKEKGGRIYMKLIKN